MEKNWLNTIQSIARRLRKINEGRIVIFTVCLAIATVFWFLNALSKEYTVDLAFPVRYTNMPANKVLANTPPSQFVLKVNSYGFTILRHKLSMAFSPIVFNVNEFTGGRLESSPNTKFSMATRRFINRLSGQVSNELQIIEIQPDTLYFEFDRLVKRKVKVKPAVSYSFKKQFYPSGLVSSEPDSVLVAGPESILDTLRFVETSVQSFTELDKTVQQAFNLKEYTKLDFQPKRVTVTIPVEEFTQKQLMVPVRVSDVPPGVAVKLFPERVKLSFLVGLSHFNQISEGQFVLTVPYADIEAKKPMLPVSVLSQPQHILSVSVSPEQVEYLIEKNANE